MLKNPLKKITAFFYFMGKFAHMERSLTKLNFRVLGISVSVLLTILLLIFSINIGTSKNEPVMKAATSASHVIINQVFGGGSANDSAISHGFIELYNPTDQDIDLSTSSIQYSKGKENGIPTDGPFDWNVLNLTGKTIKAHQSFLILCDSGVAVSAAGTPRYTILNWDMSWSQEISNRSFHVALVSNQSKLSPIITANESEHVIDLIAAKNTGAGDVVYNFEGASLDGISKQKSARRIDFQDNDDNNKDFEIIDYRTSGINDDELARVKPRYSGDGVWGTDITPDEVVDEDKKLIFSHKAGLYASSFDLSMTTGYSSGIIRYTTDGSDPVANSKEYTTSISIQERTNDTNVLANFRNITSAGQVIGGSYTPPSSKIFKGNVIKAQVFSTDGKALTDVYTNSYFVNAKYDNLPVISLVTDKAHFFDDTTGIYVNGNYFFKGSEWERPIHFEMFEPDGTVAVSQNMGVRNNGGVTRNLPQKSLRLYAKKGYDEKNPTVEYDLFQGRAKKGDGTALTSFKRLVLRNSGNDNGYSLFRDAMMQSLVHDTNTMIQAYRQSVVFLNGEFWGIYNIRERIDDESVLRKYDIDDITKIGILEFVHNEAKPNIPDEYDETIPEMKDDYDAYMEMWNWFNTTTSLDSTANYLKAQTFIDMDSFIDYYIINVYVNNNDWPGNNNQIWRYRTAYPTESTLSNNNAKDGRWRWMLKDTDSGFSLYTGTAETKSLERLAKTTGTDYSNATWSTLFFRRLITNQEFKDKFVNRFCDLLNTNFNKDVVIAKIDEMSGNISGTIDRHIARWPNIIYGRGWWEGTIEKMKTFADGRVSNMQTQLKSFFSIDENMTTVTLNTSKERGYLTINGIPITNNTDGVTDPSSWSGTYFINKMQTISAIPYEGYRFDKFIVGSKEYSEDTINVMPTEATIIQAIFVKTSSNESYTITVAAGAGGNVTGGGVFKHGQAVTLTATPQKGYYFVKWLDGDKQVSTKSTYSFMADHSKKLTAAFAKLWIPTSVKTKSKNYQEITIGWNEMDGAVKYNIYRAEQKNGNYKNIKTVTAPSYTDTKRVTNKNYYYKICAVYTSDGKMINSEDSNVVRGKSVLPVTTGLKVKKSSMTSSKLNWKKVPGASGYEIYRANKQKNKYKKVGNTKRTTYKNQKLTKKRTYFYKVRAYRVVSGKKVYGNFSGIKKIKI